MFEHFVLSDNAKRNDAAGGNGKKEGKQNKTRKEEDAGNWPMPMPSRIPDSLWKLIDPVLSLTDS